MAEILEGNRVVTQITTVKLTPDKQDEVLNLTIEGAAHGDQRASFHCPASKQGR